MWLAIRRRLLGPCKHGLAEVAVVVLVYRLYSAVRGMVEGPLDEATDNAAEIIAIERAVGLFREAELQQLFLDDPLFLQVWNAYYGVAHFALPAIALVGLWLLRRERYWLARNAMGFLLLAGLVGFVVYPLLPPRFLPESFGFIDSAAVYGPSMFSEDPADAANLYAAMPSLHVGWSLWTVWALWPVVNPRWGRALLVLYPAATTFAVMVTGNHYWFDGVGGAIALVLAIAAAHVVHRRWSARWRAWAVGSPRRPGDGVPTTVPGDVSVAAGRHD